MTTNTHESASLTRIMIVDDNQLNREILSHHLRHAGYEIATATGGKEAIASLASQAVDLILLDVMMPDMDGFETLERIRALYSVSELPVIMITALSQSKDIIKALSLGANDYITKPIDTAVALARIRTHLNLLRSERALRESQERYALAAEGTNDGLWDWDLRTNRIYFSPRWQSMLGFGQDQMEPSPKGWFERIHPDDRARVERDIQLYLDDASDGFAAEHRILHQDGSYIWVFCRGLAVRDAYGKPYRMAGSQTDITAHGLHDSMTGLPKRTLLLHSLARAARRDGSKRKDGYAALYLDLDRFKLINDGFGHGAGDQTLIEVARRLDACISARDTLARLEGDDFAIVLSRVKDSKDAVKLAKRIQAQISEPYPIGEQEISIEVSIGIAFSEVADESPENLLRNAHTALFQAKRTGPGTIDVFDSEMREQSYRQLQLESSLRQAVRDGAFHLAYQPQIALKSGKLTGLEVLIRWDHSELGSVPPSVFIPIAEELGLIGTIGEWVLENAIVEAKSWRQAGIPPIRLAINLSPKQFRQFDLVDKIKAILEVHGFGARYLDVEITESVLMEHSNLSVGTLRSLHDLGVRISIDDFGTGYSSLGYLKRFPIDCIKIDKSFVQGIHNNPDDKAITTAIIAIARAMNMSVIAEGVESPQHIDYLASLGCEEGQGHFFSPPLGCKDMLVYLREAMAKAERNHQSSGAASTG